MTTYDQPPTDPAAAIAQLRQAQEDGYLATGREMAELRQAIAAAEKDRDDAIARRKRLLAQYDAALDLHREWAKDLRRGRRAVLDAQLGRGSANGNGADG